MNSEDLVIPSPIQEINDPVFDQNGVRVYVKRDDLIHPEVSGNKWRKLKFNILEAARLKSEAIVTFGGAYSNHLYALSSAAKTAGIKAIGIVRGEELNDASSATLRHCAARGMELHFISRSDYRLKENGDYFRSIAERTQNIFLVPEGGTNLFALPGVGEIADECRLAGIQADHYLVPAGTGGTAAGLLFKGCNVIAVAALKGAAFLRADIEKWMRESPSPGELDLQLGYHFGGYAKITPELSHFITGFEIQHHIPLEQVYTGKMFFGLFDLIKRGYFARGTTLVAVHTGGLQGKFEP